MSDACWTKRTYLTLTNDLGPEILILVNYTSLLEVAGRLTFARAIGELLCISATWCGMEGTNGLTSTQERGIALFVVNVAGLFVLLVHVGIIMAK